MKAPNPLTPAPSIGGGVASLQRAGVGGLVKRRITAVLGLWVAVWLVPPGAGAQQFHEDVKHPCQDFWMLSRQEIRACLDRDLKEADAELNRVYQDKMAQLTRDQRTTLRESQRAWLRRYDAVLTSYYSRPWSNHSIVKVLPSQIRALRDRTAYLRQVRF